MHHRPSTILLIIGAGSLIFAAPFCARAATSAYFAVPAGTAAVGTAFPVKVMLDTDQPTNAYSFDIHFSSNLLVLQGTENANSIITVWRDVPTISQLGGDVVVKGGSVTPFTGSGGEIVELDFVPSASGTATISFSSAAVYLANGKGTKVVPQTRNSSLVIMGQAGGVPPGPVLFPNERNDLVPPRFQYLALVDDPFSPGQRLLAFSVQDAGSGVKEVDAQYRSGFFWGPWTAVKNPTPLPASAWEINLRVTDNAGNLAEQTLYNRPALWVFMAEIGVAAAIIVGIYLLLK